MAKNGNMKNRDIRTINLGRPGEPARELVEIYERKFGKNKFSKLIREMIVRELSCKKEFNDYKINGLIQERKELFQKMKLLQNKLSNNGDKLTKLKIDLSKL